MKQLTICTVMWMSLTPAFGFGWGQLAEIAEKVADEVQDHLDVDESGSVGVAQEFSFPVLPIDLPMYPTTISAEGFENTVARQVDKFVGISLTPEMLAPARPLIESQMEQTAQEVLAPGAISASFADVIGGIPVVEFDKVGIEMEVSNQTQDLAAVPARIKLFLGEEKSVMAFAKNAIVPFREQESGSHDLIVHPDRQRRRFVVDDVPGVADLLNRMLKGDSSAKLGLGYRAEYRVMDEANGADIKENASVFGKCMAGLGANGILDSVPSFLRGAIDVPSIGDLCPSPAELSRWKLTIHSLKLNVRVRAGVFQVPVVSDCKGFSQKHNLPFLGCI